MKIFLAILSFPLFSFAFNTEYFDVKSESIKKIDMAYQREIISLKVSIKSPSAFSKPEAIVVREDSGFECQIVDTILLFSGYDVAEKTHHQEFEVKVKWSAGADLSGCLVELKHPSLIDARAYLFANY